MAEVDVQSETPIDRGWAFRVLVRADEGEPEARTVRLSWADYDLWSHGAAAPERVAAAVMRFLLARVPLPEVRPEFDAASLRRSWPEIDHEVPRVL